LPKIRKFDTLLKKGWKNKIKDIDKEIEEINKILKKTTEN